MIAAALVIEPFRCYQAVRACIELNLRQYVLSTARTVINLWSQGNLFMGAADYPPACLVHFWGSARSEVPLFPPSPVLLSQAIRNRRLFW